MSRKDRELHKVSFEKVLCSAETEKAIFVYGVTDSEDGIWVPKSLVDDDSEVYKKGDEGTLVLPEWFAVKEGLI